MKILTYSILLILFASFANVQSVTNKKIIFISPKSEFEIVGSSNVNTFKCLFNIKNLNKPLEIGYEEGSSITYFHNSTLVLENTFFDCGGRGINKDFHDLLRTKEYPQILLTLREVEKKSVGDTKVKALVEIQIAGISRSYSLEVQSENKEDLHISGNLKLDITDFNLEAPRKMLGMVVVSKEIEIVFNLIVENREV